MLCNSGSPIVVGIEASEEKASPRMPLFPMAERPSEFVSFTSPKEASSFLLVSEINQMCRIVPNICEESENCPIETFSEATIPEADPERYLRLKGVEVKLRSADGWYFSMSAQSFDVQFEETIHWK